MKLRIIFYTMLLSAISGIAVSADTINDAKDLFLAAEYSKALDIFSSEYAKKPKDAALNEWMGACLYEEGKIVEAQKYLDYAQLKGIPEASRYLAKIRYKNYDFNGAISLFMKYQTMMKKNKAPISGKANAEYEQIKIAKAMLDHVEKIVVIDSITVDKATFFKAYKIAPEAGSIESPEVLDKSINEPTTVFIPQSKEKMLWSEPDSTGKMRITETVKLIDGTWDKPMQDTLMLNMGGDANYPFLMQDGTTLYYASNGSESIGGYDLFITRKDADSGEYLQPQNMGMPYNSPDDDYLLAIDDVTGVGWWATDRNHIPDELTIYVFIPNKVRENYAAQDINLTKRAALTDYKSTWEGKDYNEYYERINSIASHRVEQVSDFDFILKPGQRITSYKELKTAEGVSQMKTLLLTYKAQNSDINKLKELRDKFHESQHSGRDVYKNDIIQLEKQIERRRIEIFNAENYIRKIEK